MLFVANHISYLDITVLGSLIAGSFVAKTEVARWPLFGWLAKLQRSVFVDRQVRSTAQQRDAIAERLAAGDALILFPEGTSGDGNRVLPFKSALFSVADQPSDGLTGRGAAGVGRLYPARRHADRARACGRSSPGTATWRWRRICGRVLGLGTVEVVVEFHPPTTLAECGSRKALARYCEDAGAGRASTAARTGRRAHAPPPIRRADRAADAGRRTTTASPATGGRC